jgi:hypothetical protein
MSFGLFLSCILIFNLNCKDNVGKIKKFYKGECLTFHLKFSDTLVLIASKALGIGAASFWSVNGNKIRGRGRDFLTVFWERDGNEAEKDIAESPTAIAGTPKIIYNLKGCN